MQKINISFTVEEVNLVLKALGRQPYEDVFQLIGNIQDQAQTQLQSTVINKD